MTDGPPPATACPDFVKETDDMIASVPGAGEFLRRCLCIDLETSMDGRILHTGAVLGEETVEGRGGFGKIAGDLDRLASKASFLLGHNIIGHDLPVLRAGRWKLDALLRLPVIDTLHLSPVAFPENPYHALVKDYKLVRDSMNDPVADARLAASLFSDQWDAFQKLKSRAPDVIGFFGYCFRRTPGGGMFAAMGVEEITVRRASEIFESEAAARACATGAREAAARLLGSPEIAPALGYCLAWLRVAGSHSVLPPWVRHRFPEVPAFLRRLRDLPCDDKTCAYCHQAHDPRSQLKRFFGFDAFRQKPATADGRSLQEEIVARGMRDDPLLAILPTGAGKSLCYQVPALARHFRRGVLTVVISPLQALMKDQVDNLARLTGTPFAGAICGMLTPPERGAMLERIRLGDIAILYISPEQLRNKSVRDVLAQREIGSWVFDEAHCFSKWGHDFRPDYHYASRFIREFAGEQNLPVPPVACFTATAKADVREEIAEHFRRELGQELLVFNGGSERENLEFEVQTVNASQKWERAHEILSVRLPGAGGGSAVIYTATQRGAENAADYLKAKGWRAAAYHAGIAAPEKRRIQEAFLADEIRIICATNAFGMGIDKDNVRLVLHLDIPGSLESYLQEAGRAGRDRARAECILLFDEQDVETQFRLGASSRLSRRDIAQILRGLRSFRRNSEGDVVVTAGEILRSDRVELDFDGGDRGADTKVRTAISVLEKTGFVERNENRTRVFQGTPLVKNLGEADEKISALGLSSAVRARWLAVLRLLMNSRADEAVSADRVAELPEFGGSARRDDDESETAGIFKTLNDMAETGLIKKDLLMTAFVRHKVVRPSRQILERVSALESALISALRQEEPDPEGWLVLSLARVNQRLLDEGHACVPDTLLNLLKSIARDGRGLSDKQGSLELQYLSRGQYRAKLGRGWGDLVATSEKRRTLAALALDVLLEKIPPDAGPRADFLVEFSESDLNAALDRDLILRQGVKNRQAAFEHALMFLHDQRVIILQQGLAVFRQSMTIRILPGGRDRRFTQGDFGMLDQHYRERTLQVHVMHEFARLGLEKIGRALAFVAAYFSLGREDFLKRYFAGKKEMLGRATGAESYRRIVDCLENPVQQAIVAAKPDESMLVLAGPGSGKTRVVAHRCAYLLRVERAPAQSILVLCFNHNAAISLRQRIADLAGPDARGVTVLTYHSLAMRLTGVSFAERAERGRDAGIDFSEVIKNAVRLLRGECAVPGAEPDELRDRLLAGYRHILVDEYQDIDADQYDLVSAVAGRTLADADSKLSVLAVGDDDQNIYSFRGANVEFIRRFESDYRARSHFLVENYRSTRHIIGAANALIARNRDRMKTGHPIRPDRLRAHAPDGGDWQARDPLGAGRVQVFEVENAGRQAAALLSELRRIGRLSPGFRWRDCAVLGVKWDGLMPVRAALEEAGIPVNWGLDREKIPPLHHIREVGQWLGYLKEHLHELHRADDLLTELGRLADMTNPWWQLVREIALDWREESDNAETSVAAANDYFYESLAQRRREALSAEGVFMGTIHSAKGLEFPHVFIADGGWRRSSGHREEDRRLCYVAMTRARETLAMFERADDRNPHTCLLEAGHSLRHPPLPCEVLPEEVTSRRFELLSLGDVYLDFAANHGGNHPIHRHLAALQPGSPVFAKMHNGHVALLDVSGTVVARLSAKACDTWAGRLDKIRSIRVVAMIARHTENSDGNYPSAHRCLKWEVPLLEVTWTPAGANPQGISSQS
jgi:ATP-dependent DNA helicase RecQ